jgi:hypothetical protein
MTPDELAGFDSNRAELIVEGYLTKVQPLGTTSKTRWFRITSKKLAYHRKEAGEEMGYASILQSECLGIREVNYPGTLPLF